MLVLLWSMTIRPKMGHFAGRSSSRSRRRFFSLLMDFFWIKDTRVTDFPSPRRVGMLGKEGIRSTPVFPVLFNENLFQEHGIDQGETDLDEMASRNDSTHYA